MGISTKKGDTGHTRLLSGEKVSKSDLVIEAEGALDEANSFLGLARAAAKEKRVKRIILQIQKHFFTLGAELSTRLKPGDQRTSKGLTEADLSWLEMLIAEFEEVLALPPGFIAFGQEEVSSHMDVARTGVRKLERLVVRMKEEGLIEGGLGLKYLNRLSDLIFLLACFEEKDEAERRKMRQPFFLSQWYDPVSRRWIIALGLVLLFMIITIILLLLFHGRSSQGIDELMMENMRKMRNTP